MAHELIHSSTQAAAILGVTTQTLRRWAREAEVGYISLAPHGRRWYLFTDAHLETIRLSRLDAAARDARRRSNRYWTRQAFGHDEPQDHPENWTGGRGRRDDPDAPSSC